MGGAVAATAAFTIVPRHVLGGSGRVSPNEKLNIASIGIGGQGASDIRQVSSENIIALCDVDWGTHTAETFRRFPNAKKYKDFRKMLDSEDKNIDAVTVSTPDNIHAVAAMAAIKRGKHVYCEKPLCHDIFEVRQLTEAAREHNVMTQMGIQLHAEQCVRLVAEMIKSGLIGKVRRVDIWSGKNWGGATGPRNPNPFLRRSIGTCGSARRRGGRTITSICPATGGSGGISGLVRWATWAVTSLTRPFGHLI